MCLELRRDNARVGRVKLQDLASFVGLLPTVHGRMFVIQFLGNSCADSSLEVAGDRRDGAHQPATIYSLLQASTPYSLHLFLTLPAASLLGVFGSTVYLY